MLSRIFILGLVYSLNASLFCCFCSCQPWAPVGYFSTDPWAISGHINQNCTVVNIVHLWPQILNEHQKTDIQPRHPIGVCSLHRSNLHNLSCVSAQTVSVCGRLVSKCMTKKSTLSFNHKVVLPIMLLDALFNNMVRQIFLCNIIGIPTCSLLNHPMFNAWTPLTRRLCEEALH